MIFMCRRLQKKWPTSLSTTLLNQMRVLSQTGTNSGSAHTEERSYGPSWEDIWMLEVEMNQESGLQIYLGH